MLKRSVDGERLLVLVPAGEPAKHVDQALAVGLVYQGDRDLYLVLPEGTREVPRVGTEPLAAATLRRLAYVSTPVRVWTHDNTGSLTEHVVPPKDEALAATRLDDTIPATTYSLADRDFWVTSLTARADAELTPAHTNSYLAWHIDGRQALRIERTSSGLRVTAGTDYGAHRTDMTPAEMVELGGPITSAQQTLAWSAVERSMNERTSGNDTENLEHLLQARLDTADGRAALRLGHRLERELAATRPGQRRAYVDLVGVDKRGDIHIVETKLGSDIMLGLQGLDYWMWAEAHREQLIEILRVRDHHVADRPQILLDYVIGRKQDDGKGADVRYLAPVADAIDGGIRWQIGNVHSWRNGDLRVEWYRPRSSPNAPRRPEPPRFARRLEDHLVAVAEDFGGTSRRVFLKEPERAVIEPSRSAYRRIQDEGLAHKFLDHVRSSQLFAINLFGGLTHDQVAAVARLVDPRIVAADRPVLEYVDACDRLGEATKASRHVTQIDAAIRGQLGDGSIHLLLIEVKLTEDDFGSCSGYQDPKNDRRDLCRAPAPFGGDAENCFKLRNHDREHRRRYDEHLPTFAALDAGCPFRISGYQPMRQAALAQTLVAAGEADCATIVLCAHDDHKVIWRRWREVTGAIEHGSALGAAELPASRVLGELDPVHQLQLARRYRLDPVGDDYARLAEAVGRARAVLQRVTGHGSTLEQLEEHGPGSLEAARALAQRLERVTELTRATREHQISRALTDPTK